MTLLVKRLRTSVGRKALMALTGLGLFLFVVAHLLGNFTLLMGPDAFNGYSHFLVTFAHGWFVILADLGLVAFFLVHSVAGIKVWLQKRRARDREYEVVSDAGGASRKTLASRTMIVTGPILLVFVIYHVLHFKFGPGESQGYTTVVHGVEMRDLYRYVVEEFNKVPVTLGYMMVMALLGFHLSHGIWSGFQSLGWTNRKYLPALVTCSLVFGAILAVGFLYIPLHALVVLDPGDAAAAHPSHATGGGF